MYTAVLMIALTAGTGTVDRGGRGGCHGCYGGCYCGGYGGCYGGCYGGYGCYGGCYGGYGRYVYSGGVGTMGYASIATPSTSAATIVVDLPATAKLTIDGNPTTSISARRTLITPDLDPSSGYVYTLRAEMVSNDGQTLTKEQRVTVRAGQTSSVQFSFPAQTAAAGR